MVISLYLAHMILQMTMFAKCARHRHVVLFLIFMCVTNKLKSSKSRQSHLAYRQGVFGLTMCIASGSMT